MEFEQSYVVLRSLRPRSTRSAGGPASPVGMSPVGRPRGLGLDPSDLEAFGPVSLDASDPGDPPEIEVHTGVDEKDAMDALADDRNEGIAPTMDTKLISPLDGDEAGDENNDTAWGVSAVKADTSGLTGAGVTVAVLDTGIDSQHEAFAGINITEEDFSGDGNGDKNGHGTHCAGTIFGRSVGGVRIGVAPGVTDVYVGKVLRDNRGGNTDMLFKGLGWAIQNKVEVISLSLGFDFPGYVKRMTNAGWPADLATSNALVAYGANLRLLDNLARQVRLLTPFGNGSILVAATGNESKADVDPKHRIAASLPSSAEGVLAVGALKQTNAGLEVAPFSNSRPRVTAPGVAIRSARTGGGLTTKSGTSMACPHVAGIAALWWEALRKGHNKPKSPQVETQLLAHVVQDVFAPGVNPVDRGDGLIVAPQN